MNIGRQLPCSVEPIEAALGGLRTLIVHGIVWIMAVISRTVATLRIMGDDLDPDEVTRLLGVEPTVSALAGDVHPTRSGRKVTARTNSWLLEAEAVSSGGLDDRIADLLAPLPSDPAVWRELSRHFRCDVFCGLFVDGGNAGAGLRPEVLAMLGERGLRLELDIYGGSD